jgi:hypothetical protein
MHRIQNLVDALDLRVGFQRNMAELTTPDANRFRICSARGDTMEAAAGELLQTVRKILTVDPREEK